MKKGLKWGEDNYLYWIELEHPLRFRSYADAVHYLSQVGNDLDSKAKIALSCNLNGIVHWVIKRVTK